MKGEYSNVLTKLVGMVGVTSISLLISLPTKATDVLNPQANVLQTTHYNSQYILASNATPTKSKQEVAQNRGGGVLNPRPSIFNEPAYRRGRSTTPSDTTPDAVPTTPGTVVPTEPVIPTPTPGTPSTQPGASTNQGKNLIAVAEANGQFTKLTQALKAAGLTQTLQGKGPFTVFAPTDAAFAELPQDAVQDLFKPENKEVLLKILTYHVVSGQVLSTDLKSGEVKSVEGGPISVKVDAKNGVMVNDAKVIQSDIKASNGVIHVINKVILPPDL